jgi:23S rRNA (adenine1618-N6)-methyltransferase
MNHQPKTKHTQRSSLHPKNPHQGRYDMKLLSQACPELKHFLRPNPAGDLTIDFSKPDAVLCLNKALLAHHYGIQNWNIPKGYLCPPIPGRADYIHHLADLLAKDHGDKTKTGSQVKVLDIGTGANCIYPIIGVKSYGWQFTATDINSIAIESAHSIIESNPCLKDKVHLFLQKDRLSFFKGAVVDHFDLTICNPPFHASLKEAQSSNRRKRESLDKKKGSPTQELNFGGQEAELWYKGGELTFLKHMIRESVSFAGKVTWFTSLVSKIENVKVIQKKLKNLGAKRIEVVEMSQGQKKSRFIAWSFKSANKVYKLMEI